MTHRRVATLLGSPLISDETVVTQSDKIPIGTMIESIIIELDQEKNEEFLFLALQA